MERPLKIAADHFWATGYETLTLILKIALERLTKPNLIISNLAQRDTTYGGCCLFCPNIWN
jgi:hypothetical protein